MLDFTSALYLGLQHSHRSLRPWSHLTTGRPATLASRSGARVVARRLAILQGCEDAILAPSTLHIFWDLFGMLAGMRAAIYVDSGAYPIVRWCVERAAVRGVSVRSFPHHDANALHQQLKQDAWHRVRPIVVADGLCPGCGGPAPIADYVESVRAFGGYFIMDDTQALGMLGCSAGADAPYGRGGGGSLAWTRVSDSSVLAVCSLAKGLGVPVAVLSGSGALVRWFKAKSETRMHCSPPSSAVIHAAEYALAVNHERGDALRLRLAQLVHRFHNKLREIGFSVRGGLFPVQTLRPIPGVDAKMIYERLLQLGIRTVLHRGRNGHGVGLSFLITARHTPRDIDHAVDALAYGVGTKPFKQQNSR